MQGYRFNSKFRLTIYFQGKVLLQFANPNVNFNIDFTANIIKDGFSHGNARSNIFIYNLAQTHQNTLESLITQSRTTSMQMSIECTTAYGQQQYQLITYDDIVGVYPELGENDYQTNIVLKSGEASLIKYYKASSYTPGAKLSDILKAECQAMVDGNSIKSFQTVNVLDYTFPNGFSYSGNTYNALSKICGETNNTFFVDRGVIYVAQNAYLATNAPNSKTLDFSNGLLEPPTIGQLNYTKKYQKHQSNVSFQFKSLLLPEVSINDVISVQGQLYTIKRITHEIQSREGSAFSIIEGFKNGSV